MKVLFFGDSITWSYKELGIRYPKDVRWTTIVQNILGSDYEIIEDGLPGRPTDDPEFFTKALKKHDPFDVIFIMLGSSDLKPSLNFTPKSLADNLANYVKMALDYKYENGKTPKIVLAAPPHVKAGVSTTEFAHFIGMDEEAVQKSKELAPLYKEKAQELGISFFDAGLYCEGGNVDHFHLDEDGHKKLAVEVAKFVKTLNSDAKEKIICFGDANTWGLNPDGGRFEKDVRWTGILSSTLGEGYKVIEDGLCGRSTDSPEFFVKSIRKYYPFDTIIIMLGFNELSSNLKLSSKQIAENVANFSKLVLDFDYNGGEVPKVILVSPLHLKEGVENLKTTANIVLDKASIKKSKKFAKYYKKQAKKLGMHFFDSAKYAEVSDTDKMNLDADNHKKFGQAMAEFIKSIK